MREKMNDYSYTNRYNNGLRCQQLVTMNPTIKACNKALRNENDVILILIRVIRYQLIFLDNQIDNGILILKHCFVMNKV